MTSPVFIADEGSDLSGLSAGQQIQITGPEANHIRVMRLAEGESLDIVDGCGLRARSRLVSIDSGVAVVEVVSVEQTERMRPRLVLVQALAKGGRDEGAISQVTELGVHEVIPWQSERTIVRWSGSKAERGKQKWADAVRAAAKQSRRAFVPEVRSVQSSSGLVEQVRKAVSAGAQVWLLHESDENRLAVHLGKLSDAQQVWVIVGPEGGISPTEYADLSEAGAIPVRLGDTVLRSGTAATVAFSVITYQLGWWQ